MPLTREFKATVQARAQADGRYRKELLREGVACVLAPAPCRVVRRTSDRQAAPAM